MRGVRGFVARAWRPSHLDQRRGCGCFSGCGVSLRSAPGGLPTRPTGTTAAVEVRAQRASKPPSGRGVRFRGSGLAALAPQPAREDGCLSACGVSLRSAPGGLPTRPAGTVAVVEVRAQRASKPPSARGVRFRGSGLAALAPQPAREGGCFSACGVSLRSAPGGLPTRPARRSRWLRCERSEPRNHPAGMRGVRRFRGSGLAALAPQPAREDGCLSACGVSLRSALGGLPTRPSGTTAVVEVRAKRATKPPCTACAAYAVSWLGPGGPRTSTSARGRLLLGVRGLATVGPGGPPYSTGVVVRWLRWERSESGCLYLVVESGGEGVLRGFRDR